MYTICSLGNSFTYLWLIHHGVNPTQPHLDGSDDFLGVVGAGRGYQGNQHVLKVTVGVALQVSD